MLDIRRVVCGAYQENAYIIDGDIIIDPGDDLEKLLKAAARPRAILLTHGHFDHMLSAEEMQKRFDIPVYIHPGDAQMLSDARASAYAPEAAKLPMPRNIDWQPYEKNIFDFDVIHTPGHTQGSVCLYNADNGVLFSGDTLFRAGFGRTDLEGGSMEQLRRSLFLLFKLAPETKVYPGHGEKTTIAVECGRYGR